MARSVALKRNKAVGMVFLMALLAALLVPTDARAAEKVLILSSTVSGGSSSVEAVEAAALGYAVDVVSPATWSGMSAADFDSYKAIILGDPYCGYPASPYLDAAVANRSVWGPQIDGNVVINGTDPMWHDAQGGRAMTAKGIAFAADAVGKTGAYISLSCYYHGVPAGTPVPLLDVFSPGGFTMTGVGCHNDAHIVATHPALVGMTDASLSNWSCSVHEAFSTWPSDFTVLVIAKGMGNAYTAADGTVGTPYVLARGEGLSASDISLTPAAGTDDIQASFTSPGGVSQASNVVTAEWTSMTPAGSPPSADAGGDYSVPEGGSVTLDGSASSDADGDVLSYAWDLDGDGTYETTGTTATFSAAGLDGPGSTTVGLEVCDDSACTTDTATVTITNVAPTVDAGPDLTAFRHEAITLSGTWTDPAEALDDPYTGAWSAPAGAGSQSATYGDALVDSVTFPAAGTYTLDLAVSDKDGGEGTDSLVVTVVNRDPDCSAAAPSVSALWPPNHQMVPVDVLGVTDSDGDAVTITITGIRQDEPVDSFGDGRFTPDGRGVGTTTAEVRAERAGTRSTPGNGRVYTIAFSAADGHGGECAGAVHVGIPHDQRGAAAIDDGALHDSTL